MKKAYIEPQTVVLNIEDESALCAGTAPGVGGQITSNDFENVNDKPIGEGGDDYWEPAITAKGGDFFEESISPSSGSIWGDED